VKALTVFLSLVLLCFCLPSCDSTTTPSVANGKGSSDIIISEPQFGFVSEAEYDPGASEIDTSHKWTSLDVDTSYFLFLTFDITAARNNDGQSIMDLKITFDSLDVMDGTIEDVSTGNIVSMTFTDSETQKEGRTTTASFKIPAFSAEPKKIEMVVKLRPVNVGESHIIISYNYDSPEGCKILGSDGYTKNLKINHVKIETPELALTNMGLLTWKNVKNAEYYMIYENGEAVCDIYGEPIVIQAAGYSVGGDMRYNIGNDIVGYHNFSLRAFSTNKNILQSNFSNIIEFNW
jgi:hypothetical protein